MIHTLDLYRKVRLACRDGISALTAARHFGISREGVKKILKFSVLPPRRALPRCSQSSGTVFAQGRNGKGHGPRPRCREFPGRREPLSRLWLGGRQGADGPERRVASVRGRDRQRPGVAQAAGLVSVDVAGGAVRVPLQRGRLHPGGWTPSCDAVQVVGTLPLHRQLVVHRGKPSGGMRRQGISHLRDGIPMVRDLGRRLQLPRNEGQAGHRALFRFRRGRPEGEAVWQDPERQVRELHSGDGGADRATGRRATRRAASEGATPADPGRDSGKAHCTKGNAAGRLRSRSRPRWPRASRATYSA